MINDSEELTIKDADDLEDKILDFIFKLEYSNRELSIAKTNIEQSFMWLRKGIFEYYDNNQNEE